MYAIFEAKGKQFRAEPEATLRLPSLDAEPGDRVTFDQVLLVQRDDRVIVGQPSLKGAAIAAEVVRHGRGDKIVVYKMKRRKGYRRKQGHRQGFTEVRIVDIDLGSPKSGATPSRGAGKAATVGKPDTGAERPASGKAAVTAEQQKDKGTKAAEILVTDSARALAEESGIDLSDVAGTGKDGRILKGDVQKAIKARGEA